jgi:hypothetical protein
MGQCIGVVHPNPILAIPLICDVWIMPANPVNPYAGMRPQYLGTVSDSISNDDIANVVCGCFGVCIDNVRIMRQYPDDVIVTLDAHVNACDYIRVFHARNPRLFWADHVR